VNNPVHLNLIQDTWLPAHRTGELTFPAVLDNLDWFIKTFNDLLLGPVVVRLHLNVARRAGIDTGSARESVLTIVIGIIDLVAEGALGTGPPAGCIAPVARIEAKRTGRGNRHIQRQGAETHRGTEFRRYQDIVFTDTPQSGPN
ncbi:MAG: hypothetical protein WAO07_00030, partial [Desulfobacterales bacterium]